MVHDTILRLSGSWIVIFFGEMTSAGSADEVLVTGLEASSGCQPDAGSPE